MLGAPWDLWTISVRDRRDWLMRLSMWFSYVCCFEVPGPLVEILTKIIEIPTIPARTRTASCSFESVTSIVVWAYELHSDVLRYGGADNVLEDIWVFLCFERDILLEHSQAHDL